MCDFLVDECRDDPNTIYYKRAIIIGQPARRNLNFAGGPMMEGF